MSSIRFLLWLSLAIAAGSGTAIVLSWFSVDCSCQQQMPTEAIVQEKPNSYATAVQLAAPSVINLYIKKQATTKTASNYRSAIETNLGSAVIMTADGYLLTNYHIVADAQQIKGVASTGQEIAVHLVGSDPETDLAVLKTQATELVPARLGATEQLAVGDIVLAIGNPYGVGQTVTMGIVSATGRDQLGVHPFENFIQTDAAINPGNSGGALVNLQGEVIGINTLIFSETGGSQGIGFAIPIDLAQEILSQIVEHGRVVRGWLGISGREVTPEVATAFGLRENYGIMVSSVVEGSPADQAGLRPGDVILQVEGVAPKDLQDMLLLVAHQPPGKKLLLEGWRGNQPLRVQPRIRSRSVGLK